VRSSLSQIKSLSCSGYSLLFRLIYILFSALFALLRLNNYPVQDILYFSQINRYPVQCALRSSQIKSLSCSGFFLLFTDYYISCSVRSSLFSDKIIMLFRIFLTFQINRYPVQCVLGSFHILSIVEYHEAPLYKQSWPVVRRHILGEIEKKKLLQDSLISWPRTEPNGA
jgi:hypothetical protein